MDALGKKFCPFTDQICRKVVHGIWSCGIEKGTELTGQIAADTGKQLDQRHVAQRVILTRGLQKTKVTQVSRPPPENQKSRQYRSPVHFSTFYNKKQLKYIYSLRRHLM